LLIPPNSAKNPPFKTFFCPVFLCERQGFFIVYIMLRAFDVVRLRVILKERKFFTKGLKMEIQPLPQNQETEKTILASLIYDNSLIPQAASLLTAENFYTTNNQRLFYAILDLHKQGLAVDVVTLASHGVDSGYLAELSEHESTVNLKHHADSLKSAAFRRQAITAMAVASQKLYDPDASFTETVNGLADAIKLPEKSNEPLWTNEELTAVITQIITTTPKPFEFLIPKLLPKGICGFIYGEGGSYKSLAALWLCIQRACGYVANSKWLDRFEIFTVGKSMFCSVEDQIIDIQHRAYSIIDCFAASRTDIPRASFENAITENFSVIPRELWMKDNCEHIIDLEGNPTIKAEHIIQAANGKGVDLIIIDTLSRISPLDENDNKACSRLVSVLEHIRDLTGATVLVIAHTSKAGRTAQTDRNGQNGLRGASALMDNGRFGLWFKSLGKNELEIVNSKTFRTGRVEPFKIKIEYPKFMLIDDDTLEDDLMNAVVTDVKEHSGTTQRQTRSRLKKDMKFVSIGFSDAVEEGLIINNGRGKGYVPA
jgi:hypothetical protein